MAKIKLTPWFPCKKKPVRNGVYELEHDRNTNFYHYWDGERFCGAGATAERALMYLDGYCCDPRYDLMKWRGISK